MCNLFYAPFSRALPYPGEIFVRTSGSVFVSDEAPTFRGFLYWLALWSIIWTTVAAPRPCSYSTGRGRLPGDIEPVLNGRVGKRVA